MRIVTILLTGLLLGLFACTSQINSPENESQSNPQDPLPEDGLNILFIGNSLTYVNDLPQMLKRLLLLGEVDVGVIESQSVGNYGLPDHWQRAETREQMNRVGWDLVVLQQGPSATEGRPYLLEYAPLFAGEVSKVGARTALYMVWPDRIRFYDFQGVSDSYRMAAESVNGLLFPAGEAWLNAWEQDELIALYGADGFHPSVTGTYLAALTMFEQVSGESIDNLPNIIPATSGDIELSLELATILKNSAKQANLEFAINTPLSTSSQTTNQ